MQLRKNSILTLVIVLMLAQGVFLGFQYNEIVDGPSEGSVNTDISLPENYSNGRSVAIKQPQNNQNKPLTNNNYQRSDSVSISTKGSGGGNEQIVTLADATFVIDFNETHSISDTLQGFGNDPWDNEPVYLYRTLNLSKDAELGAIQQSDLISDPDYENTTLSQITDGTGAFTFNLAITSADIEAWIYFVFFNGNGPRGPGVVYSELLTIKDTTDFTVTVDKTNVGTSEAYTYLIQGTSKATGLGSTLQGLQVQLDESYLLGSNAQTLVNEIGILGATGAVTVSSTYGVTTNWAQQDDNDNITLVVSFPSGQGGFSLTTLPTPITNPSIVTATQKFTFQVSGTIDGIPLNNTVDRYYRSGQNVSFVGLMTNQSIVGDGSQFDLDNALNGNDTSVQITDWTGAVLPTLQTNLTGFIFFSFLFNTANFLNLDPTGDTTFVITFTITETTVVSDPTVVLSINAKENLASITGTDNNIGAFYNPDSSSIVITGQVKDVQGKGAANIPVNLNINDKTAVNASWSTVVNSQNNVGSAVTNGNGDFTIILTNFNFAFTTLRITLNITIGSFLNTTDFNPPGIASITFETSTFKYYDTIITTVQVDVGTGLQALNLTTNLVLNDTFVDYRNNDAYYLINVRDQFNRNVTGLEITVTGLISPLVVSASKSDFRVNFSQMVTLEVVEFNLGNKLYTFNIVIASNYPSLSDPHSENFQLFGPDNFTPGFTSPVPDTDNNDIAIGEDLYIEVTIDPTKSALDNIQYVVLYYRISTNSAIDQGDAIFVDANLTIVRDGDQHTGGVFNFTITFETVGNGHWIEFYIEVADYAGYGLTGLAVSDSTNLPTGYGWDTNFSLNSTLDVTFLKFGDNEIFTDDTFDYVDAINVNFQPLTENTNIDPGEDILIDLRIPTDNLLYDNITFSYQVITFDKDGNLLSNGTYTHIIILETDLAWPTAIGFEHKFQFFINGTNLVYFQQVNYNFTIFDVAGNKYMSPQIINEVINAGATNTQVTDEENPVDPDPTRDWVTEITEERVNTPFTKQVYNINETGYVSYNITDTGIGISNITLTMYYYDADGNLVAIISKLLVDNGTILFPEGTDLPVDISNFLLSLNQISNNGTFVNVTESAGEYFMQFYVNFESLLENMTVSWDVTVNDIVGNEIVVNPQGVDQRQFEIINPPEVVTDPLQTVSTIISVDSDGNTFTIISTIVSTLGDQEEEDSGNALLVILTFSLFVFAIALYYQRHNIREYFEKSARKRKARSTLSELIDEIKRLGAEEKYKAAIRLVWEALERLSKEILQVPRAYNQTAREFTSYLSTITIVDRETLLTISNAFEAAKYGKDEPTYDDWDDAVKALDITVNTIIESGARVQIEEDDDDF